MTPQELSKIINKQEQIGSKTAVLSISKPKSYKLKGFRMKTPFGFAEVYNMREYDDHNEFTVCCNLEGLKKVLEDLKMYGELNE